MEEQKKKQMSQKTCMTKANNTKADSKVKKGNMITDKERTSKVRSDKTLRKISNIRKESTNQQTGITLIALVISIIVMLILAGVSLSMTVGENGIITKAKLSLLETKFSGYKEVYYS